MKWALTTYTKSVRRKRNKSMAIFHLSTKPISRKQGRSAVASAAYRAGESLSCDREGKFHDYTKKTGIEYTEILVPHDLIISREQLWNIAEKAEKRSDARTAREWEVALPAELNQQQRKELVIKFGHKLLNQYGVAVDIAIHKPHRKGDERNYHAHIMVTTREVIKAEHGFSLGDKTKIELSNTNRIRQGLNSSQDEIKSIREAWANLINQALEKLGSTARVDHRSLIDQGITDREPTFKMGIATHLERAGISTTRGDLNRNVIQRNQQRKSLSDDLMQLYIQKGKEDFKNDYLLHQQIEEGKQQALKAMRQHLKSSNPEIEPTKPIKDDIKKGGYER